jgi:glucose/arabinose dehydrogenase
VKWLLAMATLLVLSTAGCTSSLDSLPEEAPRPDERIPFRVLTTGLADPWEITWGPDGLLWVIEDAVHRRGRTQLSGSGVR